MKILLFGGTGFVGRSLLRQLLDQPQTLGCDYEVTVVSRNPSLFLERFPQYASLPWLRFHNGDVLNPDSLPSDGSYTHLIHAASDTAGSRHQTAISLFTQVYQGTKHVLELAVSLSVSRFLYISSGAVYGLSTQGVIALREDDPGMLQPSQLHNTYGIAKLAAEHLCALFHDAYGIETVVARCFSFVGPDIPLDSEFAIGNFIRDALWSESIMVLGDGSHLRSYLAQSDLAQWLLILLQEGRPGEAYNVGSDEAISIGTLAHLVRDIVAPKKSVLISNQSKAYLARSVYIPDISKSKANFDLPIFQPLSDSILQAFLAHSGAGMI